MNIRKIRRLSTARAVLCWLFIACVLCNSARADVSKDIGLELKAAYLVNIAKFVDWPNHPAEIVLCLHQASLIRGLANDLDGQPLGDDRIFRVKIDPPDLANCQILFLDEEFGFDLELSDVQVTHQGLLIITDVSGDVRNDVAIRLFFRDLKLRIAINENIASLGTYKISSKLLQLSRKLN